MAMAMRKNGFECPSNGFQLSTYALFVILSAHFGICLTPCLPTIISIVATSIFGILAVTSIYFGYVTTKTDSIDEHLHQHVYHTPHPNAAVLTQKTMNKKAQQDDDGTNASTINHILPNQNDAVTRYCWVCQTHVHEESLHCQDCRKCVKHFDHHCIWLNTCIGEANYHYFFKTVSFTFVLVLVHFFTILTFAVLYFMDLEDMKQTASEWFQTGRKEVLMGINLSFLILTAFLAMPLFQLFYFHVGLRRKKMTTYEYVLQDRARKQKVATLAHRIKQRRQQELNRSDITCMTKSWIKVTGASICKPCDPIRKTLEREDVGQIDNAGNSSSPRNPTGEESDNNPDKRLNTQLHAWDSDNSEEGSRVGDTSESARTGCFEMVAGETKTRTNGTTCSSPTGSNAEQANHY